MSNILALLDEVARDISKVNQDIQKVEEDIRKVDDEIHNLISLKSTQKLQEFLRYDKSQLRDKERQLRDKEKQLREDKRQFLLLQQRGFLLSFLFLAIK